MIVNGRKMINTKLEYTPEVTLKLEGKIKEGYLEVKIAEQALFDEIKRDKIVGKKTYPSLEDKCCDCYPKVKKLFARLDEKIRWIKEEYGDVIEQIFVDDPELESLSPYAFQERLEKWGEDYKKEMFIENIKEYLTEIGETSIKIVEMLFSPNSEITTEVIKGGRRFYLCKRCGKEWPTPGFYPWIRLKIYEI